MQSCLCSGWEIIVEGLACFSRRESKGSLQSIISVDVRPSVIYFIWSLWKKMSKLKQILNLFRPRLKKKKKSAFLFLLLSNNIYNKDLYIIFLDFFVLQMKDQNPAHSSSPPKRFCQPNQRKRKENKKKNLWFLKGFI